MMERHVIIKMKSVLLVNTTCIISILSCLEYLDLARTLFLYHYVISIKKIYFFRKDCIRHILNILLFLPRRNGVF